MYGLVGQAEISRKGPARNERDSLPWRLTFEDFFFHDQIGESSGRRTLLANCGRTCSLHLGAPAAKWCDKILHPKSRIEKLGVKPGARVSLLGSLEAEFLTEISKLTKSASKGKVATNTECIFFAADSKEDLGALPKIPQSMKGAPALWIVYPKGQKHITENDVLAAGRKTGLKDIKVVGFSATHTALKFVIPLVSR